MILLDELENMESLLNDTIAFLNRDPSLEYQRQYHLKTAAKGQNASLLALSDPLEMEMAHSDPNNVSLNNDQAVHL